MEVNLLNYFKRDNISNNAITVISVNIVPINFLYLDNVKVLQHLTI